MEKMNVLSLFDGMSGGRQALEKAGIEVNNYYASEIDKYAIQVTMANYPDTIQLGSVTEVDGYSLPKIQMLIGGSPCFVKGTKVLTDIGYKNIEDIVVGDSVYTHKSVFNKVLEIGGNKQQDIYSIKAQGMIETFATAEHPYYVKSMSRKWDNEKRTSYRHFSESYWKEASKLTKGDFVGLKINEIEDNPLNLTKEEAFLIGRYIADGHTRKDMRTSEGRYNDRHWQMIISVGESKLESFKDSCKSFNFSCYKHTKSVYRCVFSKKRFVEIVEEHCGSGAINKRISPTLLNLPTEILAELIDGYVSGDGCIIGENIKCSTISKDLTLSLCMAVAKVYKVNTNITYNIVSPTTVIEGRTVNQQNSYSLSFNKKIKKQGNAYVSEGFIWLPIKSIELCNEKQDVFNIEVENDNTYTANNIIVHNCQSFSFAGKRKGMSTKCETEILTLDQYLELKNEGFEFEGQSFLFWEYMRLLNEVKPKYFLLENVMMSQKWEKILTQAIGVNPIMINSNLVSAQNRKRFYWTNIGAEPDGFFGDLVCKIEQPKDKKILLKDILEKEVDPKYFLSDKLIAGFEKHKERHEEKGTGFGFKPKDGSEKGNALRANAALYPTDNMITVHNLQTRSADRPSLKNNRNAGGSGHLSKSDGKNYCLDTGNTQAVEIVGGDFDFDGNFRERENGKSGTLRARAREDESCSQLASINSRIRRLTPKECMRLQTISDSYKMPVSDSQCYKMIGNGWTISVIAHIFSYIKK